MAKSYNEIVMDFRKANEAADRLQKLSSELRSIADEKYNGTLRSISNNWKGENAENYVRKGEKVQKKIFNSSNDLKRAAETIRTIARNTYEAEMRAWRIAQEKKH